MAKAIGYQEHTPADELRRLIGEAEQALGKLHRTDGVSAMAVLRGLDRVFDLLPSIEARGVDLRAEYARMDTLHAGVKRKGAVILRALRSEGGIEELRREAQPDESQWWWFLERDLREKRRQTARRVLFIALVVVAVGALLTVLYNRYLRPDPAMVKAYELLLRGESLAMDGDYQEALDSIEEAQAYRPDDPELMIWRGVLREKMGDTSSVEILWLHATDLLGGDAEFRVARGQIYMQVGQPETAALDAIAALEQNPSMGEAYLLLGSSHEVQGNRAEAIASYEQASKLADSADDPQLSAFARMRMAMLLQQIP